MLAAARIRPRAATFADAFAVHLRADAVGLDVARGHVARQGLHVVVHDRIRVEVRAAVALETRARHLARQGLRIIHVLVYAPLLSEHTPTNEKTSALAGNPTSLPV